MPTTKRTKPSNPAHDHVRIHEEVDPDDGTTYSIYSCVFCEDYKQKLKHNGPGKPRVKINRFVEHFALHCEGCPLPVRRECLLEESAWPFMQEQAAHEPASAYFSRTALPLLLVAHRITHTCWRQPPMDWRLAAAVPIINLNTQPPLCVSSSFCWGIDSTKYTISHQTPPFVQKGTRGTRNQ